MSPVYICTSVPSLDSMQLALWFCHRWLVTRGEFGADEFVNNASVHLPPEKVGIDQLFLPTFDSMRAPRNVGLQLVHVVIQLSAINMLRQLGVFGVQVVAVDTNGAGDTFATAYMLAMAGRSRNPGAAATWVASRSAPSRCNSAEAAHVA